MENTDCDINPNNKKNKQSIIPKSCDFDDQEKKIPTRGVKTNLIIQKANKTTPLLDTSSQNNKDIKGLFILILSVFMYSIQNLISKYLSVYYPNIENLLVNLLRGIYMILISGYIIINKDIKSQEELKKDKFKTKLLILRCFFGAISNILLFESFKYMRISSAFTIFCTYPIWVSIISVVCFKSAIRNFDILSYFVCFISVIFISKPAFVFTSQTDGVDSGYGIFIATLSAIGNAVGVVLNKYIADDFHYITSSFFFGIFFMILSGILLPFTENRLHNLTFISFFLITILSIIFFIGLSLFVLALNIGNPVKILPGTYSGVVFSLIYNCFIFGKPVDFLDLLGSFLIILFNTLGTCNIKI